LGKGTQQLVLGRPRIQSFLDGKQPKDVIYVPNRLVNLVIA